MTEGKRYMNVAINDLAFQRSLYNRNDALRAVEKFIHICHMMESIKCHNVNRIVRSDIDKTRELYPGKTIYSVIQEIPVREERTYFLGLMVNRGVQYAMPEEAFVFHDMKSYICAAVKDDAMVSIETDPVFSDSLLSGMIGESTVSIRNISDDRHIHEYRELLGLRIYMANDRKHKKDRFNAYGKNIASPMRLEGVEAQELLDRAIEINGRLYAQKGDVNYAFQQEQICIYHGYEDYDLPANILSQLNQIRWD